MIPDINYSFIAAAESFYEERGYQRVPLPWTASKYSIEITKPAHCRHFPLIGDQCLVGSGEQSFIDLILGGEIGEGWFFGTTPCFRDDVVDELHGNYFLKVELARILSLSRPSQPTHEILEIAADARLCFGRLSGWNMVANLAPITDGDCRYDLVSPIHKVELGSYGLRRIAGSDKLLYYGTGLAEPRFSYTLKKECLTSRAEILGSKL